MFLWDVWMWIWEGRRKVVIGYALFLVPLVILWAEGGCIALYDVQRVWLCMAVCAVCAVEACLPLLALRHVRDPRVHRCRRGEPTPRPPASRRRARLA